MKLPRLDIQRSALQRLRRLEFGPVFAGLLLATAFTLASAQAVQAQESDKAFEQGLKSAFQKSRTLEGLDLSGLQRKGAARLLHMGGNLGTLRFFNDPDRPANATAPTSNPPDLANEKPAASEPAAASGSAPASQPEPPQPQAERPAPPAPQQDPQQNVTAPVPQDPQSTAADAPQAQKAAASEVKAPEKPDQAPSIAKEQALGGSFHFSYERAEISLSALAGSGLGKFEDLVLRDAVILFSSAPRKLRLKKLAVSNKANKFLRKFITGKRREIELPAGGLLFARLDVKNTPFFAELDKALSLKGDAFLVEGELSGRLVRRLLKLKDAGGAKGPGIQPDDLKLSLSIEGFRPQKIGRYVDASDVTVEIVGSKSGKPAFQGQAASRYGIGSRKVKVRSQIAIKPMASDGDPVFEMRANATPRELRNVKVDGNPVQELAFQFSLNDKFEPRLRAEGFATGKAGQVPLAGELDREDGKQLFKLDGSTLEAVSGLDIPGLDEIKLPDLPALNTGKAVVGETVIRGLPSKVALGPLINKSASYIALAMEQGGIENMIPTNALGIAGQSQDRKSVFLYVPKGHVAPKLSDLPEAFQSLFSESFSEHDLARSKPGLNLFQTTSYSGSHPFSKGLALLRQGKASPTTVKMTGTVNPLVFDEPEDSARQTWSGSEAQSRLRSVVSAMNLRGQVSGLTGIELGSLFRLQDTAEFTFRGSRSGKLSTGLVFGGALKLHGAKLPRWFEIEAKLGQSGRFSWQGEEVDGDGVPVKSGAEIVLAGNLGNGRLSDMSLRMSGKFRLGDLLDSQITEASELEVRDLLFSKTSLVGSLSGGTGKTEIFISTAPGSRLAVAVLNGVKPAAYVPGLQKTPFADIALPDSVLVIADGDVDRKSLTALPNALSEPLMSVLDQAGLSVRGGITFISRLAFNGSDPLSRLLVQLGVSKNETAVLHGAMPARVLHAITRRSGSSAKGPEYAGTFNLRASLPPVSVPGLRSVLALDGPAEFLVASAPGQPLSIGLNTRGQFTVPIVNKSVNVTANLGLGGDGKARQIVIDASAGPDGADRSNQIRFQAKAPLAQTGPNRATGFVVTVENGMTLADLLGMDIAGLGALRLDAMTLSPHHVKGRLSLGDHRLTANLATFAGTSSRILTLEAESLPGLSVIPGLSMTPFSDVRLQNPLLSFIPPLSGNDENNLHVDQLPKVLGSLKDRLAQMPGGGQGRLRAGLALVADADLGRIQSVATVLKQLKAGGGKRFSLGASMPGAALAFLSERLSEGGRRKSGASTTGTVATSKRMAKLVIDELIQQTDISIPIPAIRLPGVGAYLSARQSTIKIAGSRDPASGATGLETRIASLFDFAVPGTPIRADVSADLMLQADSSKNMSGQLTGNGSLTNADGSVQFRGRLGTAGEPATFEIAVSGNNLTLGRLSGLDIPGITDLALNQVRIRPGELSGEIELKGAKTKVSAFDFSKERKPLIAMSSTGLSVAKILPAAQGTLIDTAGVDLASFLYVPGGRNATDVPSLPDWVGQSFDPSRLNAGMHLRLAVTPVAGGQLAEMLRGIGISSDAPFDITGSLPANLFRATPAEVLPGLNLKATLPSLTFSSFGSISVGFPGRPVLTVAGAQSGLSAEIETGFNLTLPGIKRAFAGQGKFSSLAGEGGRRTLQFTGRATDAGGKPAVLEARLNLPGTPKDFYIKFAGEQTLNSLLGIDLPVIGDLGIQNLEKGEDFLVGTIKLKGAETAIGAFRQDGRWSVALSASGLKPSEFIPGLSDLPVQNLVLPSALFLYVANSENGNRNALPFDVASLPQPVQGALANVLKPLTSGATTVYPGLNLKALLDVDRMPGLRRVFNFAAIPASKPLPLSGRLPVQSLRALTAKGSGFAKQGNAALRNLIAQVNLQTDLVAVNLPGVRDVVHFDTPKLKITGSDEDSRLGLTMRIDGSMQVSLPRVNRLDLDGEISLIAREGAIGLEISGTGAPAGKPVQIAGSVLLDKSDPRLQLTFKNSVTVADLIGTDLPALADLAISDVRFGSEIISGTVVFRGARTTLSAFGFKKDKRPFVALLPEALDAANFIPGLAGSPLDNAKLTRGSLIYVPDGKTSYPASIHYPPALQAALARLSGNRAGPPSKGLKAAFEFALKENSPVTQALRFAGVGTSSLNVSGELPVLMLNGARTPNAGANLATRTGGVARIGGAMADAAIRGVDLRATLPAINLPGLKQVLLFGDPRFRIKGSDVLDANGVATGKAKIRIGVDSTVTLRLPGHDLNFDGGFDIEKSRGSKGFRLALFSSADVGWKKAFALPFLDLDQIGLAGAIERKEDGSTALAVSLNSKLKLSSQVFDSEAAVTISPNGLPDVKFNIHNKVEVASLPGLDNVPGLNEVAFSNLWIGTGGFGGRARIDKLGVGGEANLFLREGKPVLLVRPDQLSLKDLLPKTGLGQMWDGLLGIQFPRAMLAMSATNLNNVKVSELPPDIQPMLRDLTGEHGSPTLTVKNGISLLAALDKENLPPQLQTLVSNGLDIFDPSVNGGISGPLLLSGSLSGLFDGALAARLAVKLPQINIPKGGPNRQWANMASFDSAGAEAVMELSIPQGIFLLGAAGNVILDVPRIDQNKSDKIQMKGGIYVGFDAVSWAGSFKMSGAMIGDWPEPMGLMGGTTLKTAAIVVGVDTEGSVEFGAGGGYTIDGLKTSGSLTAKYAFLVNINFSTTIPLPKKLALVMDVKGDYDLYSMIETSEQSVKGLFTGPLAGEVIKVLPDPASRTALSRLRDVLKKESLVSAMKLDRLPLPVVSIRDPRIFIATPGAKIPDYDDVLDTMGLRIGGELSIKMQGKRHRLAGSDIRLTLKDGLIAKGDIADMELAPIGGFKDVQMDIVANLNQLPHLKVSGDINFLGARERLDVELSKDRVHFQFERDMGRLIKTRFLARTDSGDVTGAREFQFEGETKTEINDLLVKEVFPRLGIPKVVATALERQVPLFIHGAKLKGKLVDFLKGNPVRIEIDHSFFGTRMSEPAIASVAPVWASSDPTKVFPAAALAEALTRSFFSYLQDNPVSLGRLPLGLVAIEEATLKATSERDSRIQISGKLNALGMPFSQTTATASNTGRITLNSSSTINLGLPLGAVGTLGRAEGEVDLDIDPAGDYYHLKLKVSTAALGFNDHIYFDLNGTLSSMRAKVWSDNPCARFSSESTLDAGSLRNFVFKVHQGTAAPGDFIRLLDFTPRISLPGPGDAVKCGTRVLALAKKGVDFAKKGIEEIHKLNVNAIKAVGDVAKAVIGGLKSLDCKALRLGDCPRASDCRGNERWNSRLKRCWVPGFQLARHYSRSEAKHNRCIDIDGAKDEAGRNLLVYNCHGKWNQSWRVLDDGRIQNNKGGCIGTNSYRRTARALLVSCSDRGRVLYTQYRETGQIVTRWRDSGWNLCLAKDRERLVLWECNRPDSYSTDLFFFYDPFENSTVNPGAERVKREMRAAFNSPVANEPPVPLLRYLNPKTGERKYTANPDEFGGGRNGFNYDGIVAYIFRGRAPGTVPLFRYSRLTGRVHNYVLITDVNGFGHGFHFDGVVGYVYPKAFEGSTPIYRYHENANYNYLFTQNINEIGPRSTRNWRYEGAVDYYGVKLKPPQLPPVERSNPQILAGTPDAIVLGKRAEGTLPIYKYRKRENNSFFYTNDFNEQGFGSPWYIYEGVAGYVYDDYVPGTVPLYRYYNAGQNRHGYTSDTKRWNDDRGGGGYRFEANLGYAPGPDFGPGKQDKLTNAKPLALLRYYNAANNDHLYTSDHEQLGEGRDGYVRDGIAGAIFPSRVKGSVPLYRYWNEARKVHRFTTRFDEFWYGKEGYEYVSVEGFVYPSEVRGSLPLYRYFNRASQDTVLTTDFGEFNGKSGKEGYAYQGIEAWVPPVIAPGTGDPVRQPEPELLVRYHHSGNGDFRLVRGLASLGEGRDGYAFEKVVGRIYPERAADTVPLYAYRNDRTGDHRVERDFGELAYGKNGYRYMGVLGHAYAGPSAESVELHGYFDPKTGEHLETSDFDELNGANGASGYLYRRSLGHLPRFTPPGVSDPIEDSTPTLLVRYFNPQTGDRIMMAGQETLDSGRDGYQIKGYHGYILPKRAPGTRPLYKYYNVSRNDWHVMVDFETYWFGKSGYLYKGVMGYIYAENGPGRVAVYQYLNRRKQDAVITTDFEEFNGGSGKDGYEYVGTIGYVPGFVAPGTDGKPVDVPSVPFVRYLDSRKRDHIMAAGTAAYGVGAGSVSLQGVVGRIFPKPAANTVPLYVYRDRDRGTHHYATDFSEFLFARKVNNRHFEYKGIEGYVYREKQPGSVPLVRFYNASLSDGLLTSDDKEFGGVNGRDGYQHAGVIGWVPSYPNRPRDGYGNIFLSTNDNFSCLSSGAVHNSILTSQLCSESPDLRFSLWQDGTIRHGANGLCLAVPARASDKTSVSASICDYSATQQWEIRSVAGRRLADPDTGTPVRIVHMSSGKCLGLENPSAMDDVEADLYDCNMPGDIPRTWVINSQVPVYALPGAEAPVQASNPDLLVRYTNPESPSGDHLVTIGFDELGRGKNGYIPEKLLGRMSRTRSSAAMVPLYRYHDRRTGDHLFTSNFHERRFGVTYKFEGVAGYVYRDKQPDTQALHRYFHKSSGDNALTTDFRDWGGSAGRDGYAYLGVEGWIPKTGAKADAGFEKVYVANAGNMVCLEMLEQEQLSSSRCETKPGMSLAFYSDHTVRSEGGDVCLEATMEPGNAASFKPCNDSLLQRWDVAWQGSRSPAPDGTAGFKLVHWRSQQCLMLAEASGVDGVAAMTGSCNTRGALDRQRLWWAHQKLPVFVAPGSDAPVVPTRPEPLIQYVNPQSPSGDHMLTAGPSRLGLGKDGYQMLLAEGKIFTARAAETHPFYRYINRSNGDHLYTRFFRELGWGGPDYVYDGIEGYVYVEPATGTVALHRYVHSTKGDHYYTSKFEEAGGAKGSNGYIYEGVSAWVPEYKEAPVKDLSDVYLATNDNLSCLLAGAAEKASVTSSFCHDHQRGQFTVWQDGTLRRSGSRLCLSVRDPRGGNALLTTETCDYTRDQQFRLDWVGGRAMADGKTSVQITHIDSNRCVGLSNASGQDGVAAVLSACGPAGNVTQTWVMDVEKPVFVAPYMDEPEQPAKPLPFIRYFSATQGDHLMQAGPAAFGLGKDGYEMQVAQGKVFGTRAPGTVPLYRYRNARTRDTIYTRDFHEFRNFRGDTVLDGRVGFVFPQEMPGTVPLKRFVDGSGTDHLLSANADEFEGEGGGRGYRSDGVVGWVPAYPERPIGGLERLYIATNDNLSCLDAEPSDGALLLSRFCHDQAEGQFAFWQDGTIRHEKQNLCLSARSPAAGSTVTVERCDYTRDQQFLSQWKGSTDGVADGRTALQVKHRDSGLCIGLENTSGQDGVKALLLQCDAPGNNAQTWVASSTAPVFIAPFTDTPEQLSKPVPLIRYFSDAQKDHLLQAGPEPFGLGKDGYEMQMAQGYIYKTRVKGSVPLYRYRNAASNNTLYTIDFHEFRNFKGDTKLDGHVGYVFPAHQAGLVPLRRYYNTARQDHLISGKADEFAGEAGRDGYGYDGIAGWLAPYEEEPRPELESLYIATNDNLSCLEAKGKDGGLLVSSFCEGAGALQFSWWKDGTLRHDASGYCVSARKAAAKATPLTVDRCAYTRDQQWTLSDKTGQIVRINPHSPMQITHSDNGLCIGLQNSSGQDGVAAEASSCRKVERNVQNWRASKQVPRFVPPGMKVAASDTPPVPLVRYRKKTGSRMDHVFQAGPEAWGFGKQGYEVEYPQGLVFTSRAAGTVPLYRYRHGAARTHLYTADFHEFRYARSGYEYDGFVGYVYNTNRQGLVALQRHSDLARNEHNLSTTEKWASGLPFEKTVAWVYPYVERRQAPVASVALVGKRGLCLSGEQTEPPGRLTMAPCFDRPDQRFSAFNDGSVRHEASGLCVNEAGRDLARLEACSYWHPSQRFDVLWDGRKGPPTDLDGKRKFRLRLVANNQCLNLSGGRAMSGNGVNLASCLSGGHVDQSWLPVDAYPPVEPVAGWENLAFAVRDSMCLHHSIKNGRNEINVQPCDAVAVSGFTLYEDSTLRQSSTGACLNVPEGGGDRSQLTLMPCARNYPQQKFEINWNGKNQPATSVDLSRSFRIRHPATNLCLRVKGGKSLQAKNVELRKCAGPNGHIAQNWKLRQVSGN